MGTNLNIESNHNKISEFSEAIIIKRINDGLIIKIDEGDKIIEGIIFNEDIKNDLLIKQKKSKLIGIKIKVRFLYKPIDADRKPVYTQRKYYKENEEIELIVRGENENTSMHILMKILNIN